MKRTPILVALLAAAGALALLAITLMRGEAPTRILGGESEALAPATPETAATTPDVERLPLDLLSRMSGPVALPPQVQHDAGAAWTEPPTTFFGRAVAEESGAPIAGAELFLASEPLHGEVSWQWIGARPIELTRSSTGITTDAQGLFELRASPWRSGRLVGLRAEGRATCYFEPGPGYEHASSARALELMRHARLSLNVHGTGPLLNARFELVASETALVPYGGRSRLAPQTFAAVLDERGVGELDGLPPRIPLELSVLTEAGRRFPVDVLRLEPGEHRALEWEMGPGTLISGRAVDAHGAPVVGLELLLDDEGPWERGRRYWYRFGLRSAFASATTDSAGRFRFEAVPAGRWWLGPVPRAKVGDPEQRVAALAEAIDVAAEDSQLELEFRVWTELYFEGRVVDDSGAPVIAEVHARCAEIAGASIAQPGRSGVFRVGPLAGFPHELVAQESCSSRRSSKLLATPAASGLLLRIPKSYGLIEGELVDLNGGGIVVTYLHLIGPGESPAQVLDSTKGAHFAVEALAIGEHSLVAYTRDGRAGVLHGIDVREDGAPRGLRLELAPMARLELRHVGKRAARFELLHGGRRTAFELLRPGGRRSFFTPAGPFAVRVDGAQVPLAAIELAPGEARVLELDPGEE